MKNKIFKSILIVVIFSFLWQPIIWSQPYKFDSIRPRALDERFGPNTGSSNLLDQEVRFVQAFLEETARPIFGEILVGGREAGLAKMGGLSKGDQTPVTIYDRKIEREFHDSCAGEFLQDGIWGEEIGHWRLLKPRMWTIDPIDGTADFLILGRHFGTLLAFYESGNIQVGGGYWPCLDIDGSGSTQLLAMAGEDGVLLNGKRVLKAKIEEMDQNKTVIIGSHPEAKKSLREALKRYFEGRGMKVISSTASGGEVADMIFQGTARLFIHLTPAVVDAPTNAFFAEKLGLKVSDRHGNSIFQMPFQYLQEGLFFDSIVIGTAESHTEALDAFKTIGELEEDLQWTGVERGLEPVKAIQHYNEQAKLQKGRLRFDPDLNRKKEVKKRELLQQVEASVRGPAQIIRDETELLLQLLVQENTYYRAVLDPERGALKNVVDSHREKSKIGKSTLVSEGGAPGAGKTTGGKNLAAEVARRTRTTVPVLKEDNFLWQRNLRVGPDGKLSSKLEHKFQWAKRDQVLRDLTKGRSVLKPIFDDTSGGNVLLALNKDGKVVIYNGNRMVTVHYKRGDSAFSYDEILTLPGQPPADLTAQQERRHINITDSGVFVSGTTKVRISIRDSQLVVGFQGMEIIAIHKGEPVLMDQLTDHLIDLVSDEEAKVAIQVPPGHEHLQKETNFRLVKVTDPKKTEEMLKAKEAKDFLAAGMPVVFEGQFAFLAFRNGEFVRDTSLCDVALNYRAPRIVRWVRDTLRSEERGRTEAEVEENVWRFFERAYTEEDISVPAGAMSGIVQVNTTDLAQSAMRLVHYGREQFPMYRRLFEQMGIEPRDIDDEQKRNVDGPIIKELLSRWKDSVKLERTIDGIDEYSIGRFLVRVAAGSNALPDLAIQQNERLRRRTNRLMGGNSLVGLTSLGDIFNGKAFGTVSIWNQGESLGERLKKLAGVGDEKSLREGEAWIDAFIAQEKELHQRGIVDSNPDIMEHRGLYPVHGEITVIVVSPEQNLKMGKEALELYRNSYLPDANGNNIYTQPDIINKIPAPFRDYYCQRVQESLNVYRTLRGFFKSEFERIMPAADLTPTSELPYDLVGITRTKVDIVPKLNELRNWGVEHPLIFSARIDHMRFLYTRYFIDRVRVLSFPSIQPGLGTPQTAWTALFVNAYPDRYTHFYQLILLFYEALLDNPFLLDEERYRENSGIHELLLERYRKPYEERGVLPPAIRDYAWRSFDLFLNQARTLGSSWEKQELRKTAQEHRGVKIVVKDAGEYTRLMEYLRKPRQALMPDLDGTITRTERTTNRVLPEFRAVHDRIIGLLARAARSGVLIAPTTNRRKEKAWDYVEEILSHPNYGSMAEQSISPRTSGSYLEMYYGSGMGGIDAGRSEDLKDFELSFPAEQRRIIIEELLRKGILLSKEKRHMEDLGSKINLYIVQGTDREEYHRSISQVLTQLGWLQISDEQLKVEPPYIPVKLLDAGEGVFTIVPAEADKARAKTYVKKRHGFTDEDILVLVDQPQPKGADELLVREGGITVDEENPNIPGLISTKKAIGLTGPEAAFWCLENANLVGDKTAGTRELIITPLSETLDLKSPPEALCAI